MRRDVIRNREALLTSATEAFARDGVQTSLDDIAQKAGVGSGTLYRHFPTRDDLIAGVYGREVESLCADVDSMIAELPADQALEQWMRRFVGHVVNTRGMAAALRGAVCRSEPFQATRTQILEALERLMEPGIQQGVLRPDARLDDAMKAMSAICLLGEHNPDTPESTRRLVDLLVDGLRYGAPRR
jgi:AcrR family transcriptional regulator